MEIVDDRTGQDKTDYPVVIVGTDRFLSGWGKAAGGLSYAGWACRLEDVQKVWRWVKNRGDMNRVRIVSKTYKPRGCVHFHLYVVRPGHPAIS